MDFQLSEEQRLWRKAVHDFVAREIKPLAQEINEQEEIPAALIKKMGPMGLLGMSVEEEYGGSALDSISISIAIEELAWGDLILLYVFQAGLLQIGSDHLHLILL